MKSINCPTSNGLKNALDFGPYLSNSSKRGLVREPAPEPNPPVSLSPPSSCSDVSLDNQPSRIIPDCPFNGPKTEPLRWSKTGGGRRE